MEGRSKYTDHFISMFREKLDPPGCRKYNLSVLCILFLICKIKEWAVQAGLGQFRQDWGSSGRIGAVQAGLGQFVMLESLGLVALELSRM